MQTLVEPVEVNNLEISIVSAVPNRVDRYFDVQDPSGNAEILVECHFPEQDNLSSHGMFINISLVDDFLDESKLRETNISELPYEAMECLLCMGGQENVLYTHLKTNKNRIHMHKECYQDLRDAIETLVDENKAMIAQAEL